MSQISGWMLGPNEPSGSPSFAASHHFHNLIKMWYFSSPEHCHIFSLIMTLNWKVADWKDALSHGRFVSQELISALHTAICKHGYLATYHKSCFTSLPVDFLRAEWQCGDGWGSVPHCHLELLVVYGWAIRPVSYDAFVCLSCCVLSPAMSTSSCLSVYYHGLQKNPKNPKS